MMFSSNQVLAISGNLSDRDELKEAFAFALKYSGHTQALTLDRLNKDHKIIYQITQDGKYCIGWGFKEIPEGWSEYAFKFSIDIVSSIIKQHLEEFPIKYNDWDGSYSKGFLLKCIEASFSEEKDGIKNPFYGIISFEPYTCFYHK